jgi:hypothetical protein
MIKKTVSFAKKTSIAGLILCITFGLSAQSTKNTWRSLFNGKDLAGWKMVGSKGVAVIVDSAITCNQIANTTEHTFVCTKEKFGDFILEMDVKTDSSYNTGILLRCVDKPIKCDTCQVSLYGYQLKIDPSPERRWTGGVLDDFGKTWHWLYSLEKDDRARYAYKIGKWNHFRVEAIGSSIKVWVNGIPATNMINPKYKEGYLAIKIHSLGDQPDLEKLYGRFKNIRIITKHPEKYVKAIDIPSLEVR